MRKLLVPLAFFGLAAPATAKLGPNPSNRALAAEFVKLLHEQDAKGLKAFLSPAFLLQRADGTWATKDEYLAKLPTIESYHLSDIHGTRDGDVRVIRFTLVVDSTINGQK